MNIQHPVSCEKYPRPANRPLSLSVMSAGRFSYTPWVHSVSYQMMKVEEGDASVEVSCTM